MTWDHMKQHITTKTTTPCEIRKSRKKGVDSIIIDHQCKKDGLNTSPGDVCYFTAYSGEPGRQVDDWDWCPKDCKYINRLYVISVYKQKDLIHERNLHHFLQNIYGFRPQMWLDMSQMWSAIEYEAKVPEMVFTIL